MNQPFLLLTAAATALLFSQCTSSTAVLKGDLSNNPKVIARQSADADALWAQREQARESMDAGQRAITPGAQAFYDKGFAAGVHDRRSGRGRDPFRDDEGGSDKAMLSFFGQGYDAGYAAK